MSPPSATTQRLSSPVRAAYRELSSPDPLGDSSDHSPTTARSTRMASTTTDRAPQRQARRTSSVAAPPGLMVSEHMLSPWKIKVTVEAERDDEGENGAKSVSRTYRVPLNDKTEQMRPAARRKSVSKTGSSPGQRRVTRSRRQSVTDLSIAPLGDEEDAAAWAGESRSSKKTQKGTVRRSGRNSSVISIQEDDNIEEADDPLDSDVAHNLQDLHVNTLNTTKKLTNSKKSTLHTTDQSLHESSGAYPTPSPTASSHDMSDSNTVDDFEHNHNEVGLDTVMESEGFTMIDLNSLPSARQATQYPVLPDITHANHSPYEDAESMLDHPTVDVTPDATSDSSSVLSTSSMPSHTKKKYHIGHLQLPSSTRIQKNRLVTPMPTLEGPYSSSNLPSSPPAINSTIHERSLVQSDQVVRAGSVLHNALSPRDNSELGSERSTRSQVSTGLFSGFSKESTRELRAELRFGEELAKRESKVDPLDKVLPTDSSIQNKAPSQVTTNIRCAQTQISSLRLPQWQQEIQDDRNAVIKQANATQAVVINDNDGEDDLVDDGEETMGDIWLSEARKTSSSPREAEKRPEKLLPAEKPRRALLPSPWRRGEYLKAETTFNEETLSGLHWREHDTSGSSGRFGDAIVAHPEQELPSKFVVQNYETIEADINSASQSETSEHLTWRDAEEVVDEETAMLEGETADRECEAQTGEGDIGTTKLYDTNLDAIQDLSCSPQIDPKTENTSTYPDHDSTYSSISDEDSIKVYNQRVNLSPSKHRPATPRSALKGTRITTHGTVFPIRDVDDAQSRKVVWAKRSKCMNEEWEESTRSILSSQESCSQTSSNSLVQPTQQGIEASFEVDAQQALPKPGDKTWFGWFSTEPEKQHLKHNTASSSTVLSATCSQPQTLADAGKPDALPSYLMPPSYPSDPMRDPAIPLSVCGHFTNSHFRTLHIIYRKSLKARFHAPAYPQEIRPDIIKLVQKSYKIVVDESETMGEEGIFEFTLGGTEARILERFMREIELPYVQGRKLTTWEWTVEQLAERLARIAIGETVREEEKAVEGIMRSARKLR